MANFLAGLFIGIGITSLYNWWSYRNLIKKYHRLLDRQHQTNENLLSQISEWEELTIKQRQSLNKYEVLVVKLLGTVAASSQ